MDEKEILRRLERLAEGQKSIKMTVLYAMGSICTFVTVIGYGIHGVNGAFKVLFLLWCLWGIWRNLRNDSH